MPGSTPPTSQLDWLISTNDRAILVQGLEGPAQIVRLGHRGTPSIDVSDEIAILAPRPIASLRWRGTDSNLRFRDGLAPPTARPWCDARLIQAVRGDAPDRRPKLERFAEAGNCLDDRAPVHRTQLGRNHKLLPIWRGTERSNPFRSSGESTNFRFL